MSVSLQQILLRVVGFRGSKRTEVVEHLARIKQNPTTHAVFFTCMDARLMPLRFTQSQIGDMFILRNAGNMVPYAQNKDCLFASEPAAMEFAVEKAKMKHIIICGHSDCKAVTAIYKLHTNTESLQSNSAADIWLSKHGHASCQKLNERMNSKGIFLKFSSTDEKLKFEAQIDPENKLRIEDQLSQINTLQQLENVASYSVFGELLRRSELLLNAMWFDTTDGNMHIFSPGRKKFVLIDETTIDSLIAEFSDRK